MSVLTSMESDFVHHYCYEVVTGVQLDSRRPTMAIQWLLDNNLPTTWMQAFEYAEQRSNPDFLNWITDTTLPPFSPAWSSRAEFEARLAELLDIYPELKRIGSAVPNLEQ